MNPIILLAVAGAYLFMKSKSPADDLIPPVLPETGGLPEVLPLPPVAYPPPPNIIIPGGLGEPFVMSDEQRLAGETGLTLGRIALLLEQGYTESQIIQIGFDERVPGDLTPDEIDMMRPKERAYWHRRHGGG